MHCFRQPLTESNGRDRQGEKPCVSVYFVPVERQKKLKFQEDKKVTTVQKIFYSGEDYEKDCYFFSPSISKRKQVDGKAYYVRRYFKGGKDFGKTMESIAIQNTTKNMR